MLTTGWFSSFFPRAHGRHFFCLSTDLPDSELHLKNFVILFVDDILLRNETDKSPV